MQHKCIACNVDWTDVVVALKMMTHHLLMSCTIDLQLRVYPMQCKVYMMWCVIGDEGSNPGFSEDRFVSIESLVCC
jgi:hypothetical protein